MEDVMVNKQSDAAANLGFRPGTKAHQATNFYLRPDGATDADIRKACGGLQRNLLSRIAKAGHTVKKEKVRGPTGRSITAYKIELKRAGQ
tara:strand:+ start:250 stop:519 length:270 start_codon:yes stop_codon:yes gene_type:complete